MFSYQSWVRKKLFMVKSIDMSWRKKLLASALLRLDCTFELYDHYYCIRIHCKVWLYIRWQMQTQFLDTACGLRKHKGGPSSYGPALARGRVGSWRSSVLTTSSWPPRCLRGHIWERDGLEWREEEYGKSVHWNTAGHTKKKRKASPSEGRRGNEAQTSTQKGTDHEIPSYLSPRCTDRNFEIMHCS